MQFFQSIARWVARLFGGSNSSNRHRSSTTVIHDQISLQAKLSPVVNWNDQLAKLTKLKKKGTRALLDSPIIVNNVSTGKTLLHFAALEGRADIVEALFGYEPNLFLRDGNGFSPFELAERNGHKDLARVIALQMYKNSPIHLSAFNNDVELMKKIIKEDEEIISQQDEFGNSVLHVAATHNSSHVIKNILRHLHKPEPKKLIHLVKMCNEKNLTAFQLAVLKGHKIAAYTLITETQDYAKPTEADVRALSVSVYDEQFENDLLLLCKLDFISSETILNALKEKPGSFYSKELRIYVDFLKKDEESVSMPQ